MGQSSVIAFPGAAGDEEAVGTAALREVDAAIALVTGGTARRVRLTGVRFPDVVAGTALAHARAAALGFQLEQAEGEEVATATIGPIDPAPAR